MATIAGMSKTYALATFLVPQVFTVSTQARPVGAGKVRWVGPGPTPPANALTNDEWIDTAAKTYRIFDGTTWNYMFTGPALGVYAAWRTTTNTITNSAVLVTDSVLTIASLPIGTYELESLLMYDVTSVAKMKVAMSVPAASTGTWSLSGIGTTGGSAPTHSVGAGSANDIVSEDFATVAATYQNFATAGAAGVVGGAGAGVQNTIAARISGTLTTTAIGTVAIQYAQNTAEAATSLIVRVGSRLRLLKIG